MRRTTWGFKEELEPCGIAGRLAYDGYCGNARPAPDISDCLVTRPKPDFVIIWERLPTKAPGPHLTKPWCCYINTTIFYRSPFLALPPRPWRDRDGKLHAGTVSCFFEWDRVDSRLCWDQHLWFEGDVFKCGGGSMVWKRRRWWMRRWARREQKL